MKLSNIIFALIGACIGVYCAAWAGLESANVLADPRYIAISRSDKLISAIWALGMGFLAYLGLSCVPIRKVNNHWR